MKKTLSILSVLVSSACTSTTVVKDTSGGKIVDVLHAHFAEQILQSMNRLADSEDLNKVNVIAEYNQNSKPLNESYSGKVIAQKKIVMPDTYPQNEWRDNSTKTVTTQKLDPKTYKNQTVNTNLTPTAVENINTQGDALRMQNGQLINEQKQLRDTIQVEQKQISNLASISKKEISANDLPQVIRATAAPEAMMKVQSQTKHTTKSSARKVKSIKAKVKAPAQSNADIGGHIYSVKENGMVGINGVFEQSTVTPTSKVERFSESATLTATQK